MEAEQVQRLREFKASRSPSEVQQARQELSRAARDGDNLMPRIVAAVKNKVTLGEISDTLREEFGEYVENVVF